jgi:hypothetical protein
VSIANTSKNSEDAILWLMAEESFQRSNLTAGLVGDPVECVSRPREHIAPEQLQDGVRTPFGMDWKFCEGEITEDNIPSMYETIITVTGGLKYLPL